LDWNADISVVEYEANESFDETARHPPGELDDAFLTSVGADALFVAPLDVKRLRGLAERQRELFLAKRADNVHPPPAQGAAVVLPGRVRLRISEGHGFGYAHLADVVPRKVDAPDDLFARLP
jgi:hypothetical protein